MRQHNTGSAPESGCALGSGGTEAGCSARTRGPGAGDTPLMPRPMGPMAGGGPPMGNAGGGPSTSGTPPSPAGGGDPARKPSGGGEPKTKDIGGGEGPAGGFVAIGALGRGGLAPCQSSSSRHRGECTLCSLDSNWHYMHKSKSKWRFLPLDAVRWREGSRRL